jgi:hypothetical protein
MILPGFFEVILNPLRLQGGAGDSFTLHLCMQRNEEIIRIYVVLNKIEKEGVHYEITHHSIDSSNGLTGQQRSFR